jgi:hypothetical protein
MGMLGSAAFAFAFTFADPAYPVIKFLSIVVGMGMWLTCIGFMLEVQGQQSRNHTLAVLRQLFPERFPADNRQEDATRQ